MRHGRCKIFSELSRRGYYDMPGQLHSGASISGSCPARPVPAGPRGTAAAPAHRAQDRVCSAWRTRLVTHARTPRSRAPLSSTRFPPTRPGVVRAVHARPRGPTRLRQDAAVLAVRRITQSWPMIAAYIARPPQALDARPLYQAPPPHPPLPLRLPRRRRPLRLPRRRRLAFFRIFPQLRDGESLAQISMTSVAAPPVASAPALRPAGPSPPG